MADKDQRDALEQLIDQIVEEKMRPRQTPKRQAQGEPGVERRRINGRVVERVIRPR
jgi:hypothetical protein